MGFIRFAALLPALLNGYTTPTPIQGFINEDHVRQKSFAILGEVYIDLSEDTMATVGINITMIRLKIVLLHV